MGIAMTKETELKQDKTWHSDEDCVKTISDILSLLPRLKSNGSIESYVVTDGFIRIQLSIESPRKRRWWHRSESEYN